jgi:hypothetical protein
MVEDSVLLDLRPDFRWQGKVVHRLPPMVLVGSLELARNILDRGSQRVAVYELRADVNGRLVVTQVDGEVAVVTTLEEAEAAPAIQP